MTQAKGDFSGWQPRISARTPLGRKISREGFEGNNIEFDLVQVSRNNDKKHVDEPLSLEIKSVSDRHITLEEIPLYLRKNLSKHADSAVFDVRKITANGTNVKTFSAVQQSGPVSSEATRSMTGPSVDADYTEEPSRELLESITANVLDSLGYTTTTNDHRTTREGPKAEVDVWAENPQENFSIYVSCKNWSSEVGRPTVDEEVGRVINLRKVPQLRILVVGSLTRDAKKALEASGFVTVTLGEQAHEENTKEIHRKIYKQLTETLLAIAPLRVEKVADRAETLSKELEELSDDIRRIGE